MTDPDDIDAMDLDPDLLDVPPELRELRNRSDMKVTDPGDDEPPAPMQALAVSPALFAHARRLRERAAGDDA